MLQATTQPGTPSATAALRLRFHSMALFGRDTLPHRSTLSRFLADVYIPCLTALRLLFQHDLFQHGFAAEHMGGFIDRLGQRLLVFDVDATRQAARQRALAASDDV